MMQLGNNPIGVLIANSSSAMMTSGTIKTYSDMTGDGYMALVDTKNLVISPTSITSMTTPVRLVVRVGSSLLYSDWIIGANKLTGTSSDAKSEVQQISYIGYNGTSGSLDVSNQNEYIVSITFEDEDVATGKYPYVKHGTYYSSASATQAEVASGLAVNLSKNFKRENQVKVLVERVTDSTTSSSTSGDLTVVHGSKNVTAATDISNGGMAVNDFMVIDGVAYKVTAIDSSNNIATLDQPYQGASGTVLDADASFITAANAASGNWGIKFTGVKRTNFVPGEQKHDVTRFEIQLPVGWTSTEVTYDTAADKGIGTYEEVAEMEWLAQGNDGKKVMLGTPLFKSRSAATDGTTYDRVIFTWYEDGYSNIISNNPKNVKTLYVYSNSSSDTPNNNLKTIFGI